jgi:epoxyqueuosine reductase
MSAHPDFSELTQENCRFRIVSTRHLPELQREIEGRRDEVELDQQFSKEYMFRFKFAPPEELPNAQSLIVVALPMPITKATFNWKEKRRTFALPPTYTSDEESRICVERTVAEVVGRSGYKTAAPKLPLKLLAVRSGLATYGRNNITYVSGMGSFIGLIAMYSDMHCEKDTWQNAQMMKRCETCDLCRKACPTGAISKDRFLLKVERCLTYHNERDGSIPFPKWIDPSWHNCIVGCMRCQAACPENTPFLKQVGKTAEFSEEETKLLLDGTPRNLIPASTMSKLKLLSLTDYFNELPRNLSALLK